MDLFSKYGVVCKISYIRFWFSWGEHFQCLPSPTLTIHIDLLKMLSACALVVYNTNKGLDQIKKKKTWCINFTNFIKYLYI
jgi:hypothetical protein